MKPCIALLLAVSLFIPGCASTGVSSFSGAATATSAPAHPMKAWLRQQSRAKKGAVIGALLGAALGYQRAIVLGHDPAKGALVGAAAGALAGFAIGRRQDSLHGSRDEAVARLGYSPAQGYVLAVEEVRFEPARVAPGGRASVFVRYLVVGPLQDESLTVEAFTGIKYDGKYMNALGPDTFVVPRGGGIIETRTEITIPAQAPKGTYAIEALFEDPQGRFQSSREERLYVG